MTIIKTMKRVKTRRNRRVKRVLGVLLAGLLVLFAGCGETLVDMTAEEEAKVTTYAAHIISKYNKKQPDGISRVIYSQEEPTETEEVMEQPEEEEAAVPDTEGFYNPEDFADIPTTTGTDMDAKELREDTGAVPMELSEVIGISGFTMDWTGTTVADDYMDPTGATLATPNAGNRYVILTITVTNTGAEDLLCNVAELVPDFKLYPNNEKGIGASSMLVSTDFPTMNEVVPAGGSVERLIFFQRSASDITDADTYGLEVTLNGVTGAISQK